jgi:PAS domain S-box-containing protein
MFMTLRGLKPVLLLACLPWLICCLCGAGATTVPAQVVRVGIYENNPKIFTNEKGNSSGFWPDIISYIALKEGWKIDYVHGTWAESLQRLENKDIDMMPDVAFNQERASVYVFSSETVYTSWTQVYTRAGAGIQSILDLEGKTVAVLEGSSNVEGPDGIKALVTAFGVSCSFSEVDSYVRVFELVKSGGAAAGVTSKDFGYRYKNEYGLAETAIIFQPSRLYFACPRNADLTPYLIERVDFHVAQMKMNSGSIYYQALSKWFAQEPVGQPTIPPWIIWTLIGVGSLVVVLLAFGFILRTQVRARTGDLREEIAERERAEKTIRQSEIKYSNLVEHSNDGIIIIQDGRLVFANRRMLSFTGYSMEETLGKNFVDFLTPGYRQAVLENYQRRINRETAPERYEAEIATKNRTVVTVEINASLTEYEGKPATMAVVQDTTERNRIWTELRERETRLSFIYNNVSDIIFVIDAEPSDAFRFKSVNRRFLEATGLEENQVVGKPVQEVIPEPGRTLALGKYREAVRTGHSVQWEEASEYPAGTKFGAVTISPVLDVNRNVTQLIGTVFDITERKKAEGLLEKYQEHLEGLVKLRTQELEQANLHKSQFLANMSHELRTPLNSIIGYTKLMLDGIEGNISPEQKEDLQTVYDNSKHLLSLINDLLDLSKIEAGKFEIIKEEFPVNELTSKIIPGMEKLARDKGLELTCSIDPTISNLYADKNKTKQVLFNLLGNAVKFTHQGKVELDISKKDGNFLFSVSDTGIGITSGDIDMLFKSYKQVGPARLDGYEGTGLGLVISKQFVELQGGRIWVESTPGKGSTFSFSLPQK